MVQFQSSTKLLLCTNINAAPKIDLHFVDCLLFTGADPGIILTQERYCGQNPFYIVGNTLIYSENGGNDNISSQFAENLSLNSPKLKHFINPVRLKVTT